MKANFKTRSLAAKALQDRIAVLETLISQGKHNGRVMSEQRLELLQNLANLQRIRAMGL